MERDERATREDVYAAKVVLLGDGGTGVAERTHAHVRTVPNAVVGKTTFVKRFVTGDFEENYEREKTLRKDRERSNMRMGGVATIGVYVTAITFATSAGQRLRFDCWDSSGQERLGTNRDAFYCEAACAILFFDVQSRLTYKNCPAWYRDVKRVEKDVEVILVGNKVDVPQRQVKPKQVAFHRKVEIPYIEMSAKSNYHVDKPFQHFAKKLLKDETVELYGVTALVSPEIEIDLRALEKEEKHDDAWPSDEISDSSS